MSESTKAMIEILKHYHHNGVFYEIPVEVINTIEQELEEQDKEIERLKQNIDYAIKLLEPIVAFGMDIAVKGKMLEPILDKLKEVNGSDK